MTDIITTEGGSDENTSPDQPITDSRGIDKKFWKWAVVPALIVAGAGPVMGAALGYFTERILFFETTAISQRLDILVDTRKKLEALLHDYQSNEHSFLHAAGFTEKLDGNVVYYRDSLPPLISSLQAQCAFSTETFDLPSASNSDINDYSDEPGSGVCKFYKQVRAVYICENSLKRECGSRKEINKEGGEIEKLQRPDKNLLIGAIKQILQMQNDLSSL